MTERHDETTPGTGADDSGDIDLSASPRGDWRMPVHEDLDEPTPTAPTPRAPRTVKGAAIASARIATGVIGIAAAAVVLTATVALPLPALTAEPRSLLVTPVAAHQERVCAGPLLRLGDDTGAQATTASALGEPVVTSGTTGGDADELFSRDALGQGAGSSIVSLETGEGEQELLAASQSQSVARGDFVGAAAAECLEPSDDIWLVGGATTTGRTTLLTIVNPGEVAATVEITVHSDAGIVTAPGTAGIAIAPGEHRVYSLAGLTPGLSSPVVRVQSEGALVSASLQQSTVRTLEPGGLDFITASAAPSTELAIPGIVFPDHEELEEAIAGEDYLDLNAALRMFVPGDEQAHAVVTMVPVGRDGAASKEDPVDVTVTLDPGRVTELPMSEFEAGRFVAVITSDVPLVAGVRVATVDEDGANDFSWLSSVEALEERALVAVARGVNPVMSLYNPSDEEVEVLLKRGDNERTITVAARSATSVPVAQQATYALEGFEQLQVGIDYSGSGTITAQTVSPRAPGSTPIVVYP
ncbi:DUF5719 family protein [Salinibacterium sp. GXW1014]|uniref:DUF5719 family protein n=1 Tax=Salinibacterium sp. GXW1014 TaxID=3377838 RepID=UPI003839DF2A